MTHLSLCVGLQDDTSVKTPPVVEYEDDLYGDLHDDLVVSTVTLGPNVTEYEVG